MWHHQDFPHGVCSQRGHRQGPLAWTMPVHQQHITVLPAPVISTIPRPRNKLRFYMLSIPSWKIGWQVPENKNRRAGLWMAISTGICRQHSEKCLSGLWFIQKLFFSTCLDESALFLYQNSTLLRTKFTVFPNCFEMHRCTVKLNLLICPKLDSGTL